MRFRDLFVRALLVPYAVLCLSSGLAHAQNPGVPVSEGLVLWLDAGRLDAARKEHGKPPFKNGDKVDVWYDASGQGRHVGQSDPLAQPVFQDGAVRFDGAKSFLELADQRQSYGELTVVVVAAPVANSGVFRAVLAMNEEGRNDYTSGLNLDQGPGRSRRFTTLNAEGKGFGGAVNLLKEPSDFGIVRRIVLTSTPGPGGTKLYVDGKPQGTRDRADGRLSMDRLTVGARCYNNEGGKANARGFFEGDLLEVLIYDRVSVGCGAGSGRRIPRGPLWAGQNRHLAAPDGHWQAAGERCQSAAGADVRPRASLRRSCRSICRTSTTSGIAPTASSWPWLTTATSICSPTSAGRDWRTRPSSSGRTRGQLRAPIGMALTPPAIRMATACSWPARGNSR